MIEFLRIRNLALIDDMELEFSPGMNVLTGETGAGKSFILKALDFITGERLSPDMVRPGNERAQVEALFVLPEGDLILRRELMAESGRSRFYINDALSSQDAVRELRPRLLLHTSQHGQQKLAQPSSQTGLVDAWMRRPDLLAQRDALVQRVRAARDRKLAPENFQIAGISLSCTLSKSKKLTLSPAKKKSLNVSASSLGILHSVLSITTRLCLFCTGKKVQACFFSSASLKRN